MLSYEKARTLKGGGSQTEPLLRGLRREKVFYKLDKVGPFNP